LKLQQEVHYKTLVQSSRQYEEEQDKAEVVEKDEVEEALTEKLELARQFAQQLRGKSLL
jgi:AICAR transformylase/IMP cyclohydrolase PurH